MRVFCPNSVCDRIQAHAVGLAHAIAAAFADFLVDHQAHCGFGELAAGALAAFFGGALLVVDDHRDAGVCSSYAHRRRPASSRSRTSALAAKRASCDISPGRR